MRPAQPIEFIDLTVKIEALAAEAGIRSGLVNIQTLHTTTAIVVNEHEPLLLVDFGDLLGGRRRVMLRTATTTRTPGTLPVAPGERPNGHAHCQALLLASSASLNFAEGRLQLGRWQRVFLVELDGPRAPRGFGPHPRRVRSMTVPYQDPAH